MKSVTRSSGSASATGRISAGPTGGAPAAIGVDRRTGAVFVAGTSSSPAGPDYWTVAYSRSGSVLWRALYDGPTGADDVSTALTVDSERGVVYVTGSSSDRRQPAEAVGGTTVAYATSGQRLRVDVFHGGFQRSVYPLAIALDPGRGTVFVTGTAHPTDSDTSAAVTIAYPPAR
ncbi:MAG: hypothetical protein H0V10_07285 [Geodermatophilaceae bacterium]|nr:hypothetical protein [Geodermatophilaceae bacterium]